MASVVTLSDSDDELPFSVRVQRLINDDVKKPERKISPQKSASRFHSISDSDDSRDTIPFSRDRSVSPVPSLSEFPKYCSDEKDDTGNQNGVISGLNYKNPSPVFKINIEEWKSNKMPVFLSSDDDELPDLTDEIPPAAKIVPKNDLRMNTESLSSEEDAVFKKTNQSQEKRSQKEAEKEMRKKIRLEKQKEKELMKALKASEKEILKSQKPEECLKNMKVVLDHNLFYLEGSQSALNVLDQNNLNCSFEDNLCKYSVNWYRKVVNITTENQEVVRLESEELTDTLVVVIPNNDFLKMVHAYVQKTKGKSSDSSSMIEFVVMIKSLYPNSDITCVTVGFQKYLRNIKEESDIDLKTIAKQIPKNAPEEAILELQLQLHVNFKFLENMDEFGNLLHHFTKAIAEAPQRKEKQQQKALAFSWYADVDSQCPVKLAKDKSSFIKLWRQQVQQFNNVGPEVAEAIISHYPSPRLLLKAYNRCATTKDAENLLQDIVVRRGYGPCENQKRIGPELSYKIFLFFTSRDGNKLLKR